VLPDISGVVARGVCSVPWEPELRRLRCDGAPAEQLGECQRRAATQILAATREIAHDPALAALVRYYRRHRHLRFASMFEPAAPALA
jgi:hypothetical protein